MWQPSLIFVSCATGPSRPGKSVHGMNELATECTKMPLAPFEFAAAPSKTDLMPSAKRHDRELPSAGSKPAQNSNFVAILKKKSVHPPPLTLIMRLRWLSNGHNGPDRLLTILSLRPQLQHVRTRGNGKTNTYELCFSCHNKNMLDREVGTTETNFRKDERKWRPFLITKRSVKCTGSMSRGSDINPGWDALALSVTIPATDQEI